MYSRIFGIHGMIGAFIAVAIIGLSAFIFDRGYLFSAPDGVVQVGTPTPVAVLDEITVTATR